MKFCRLSPRRRSDGQSDRFIRVFLANSEFADFHPRVQDELSQSFDFPIFKRSNQIETGLSKGESENRQSDALRHCSILFACLTLTTAELHAAIGV
jgi:hypothetical protein